MSGVSKYIRSNYVLIHPYRPFVRVIQTLVDKNESDHLIEESIIQILCIFYIDVNNPSRTYLFIFLFLEEIYKTKKKTQKDTVLCKTDRTHIEISGERIKIDL
jgi:hypothetical protein